MDSSAFFWIFLALAACEDKARVSITNHTQNVNLVCGEPLTLSCEFNASVNCSWKRHGRVVKMKNGHFSELKVNNGSTVCSFYIPNAEKNDQGNWTCGLKADHNGEGITSKNITVSVHGIVNETCKYITSRPAEISTNLPNNDNNWIIIVGALAGVIIVMILGILIWIFMKKKKCIGDKQQSTSSIHDYEEIDENALEQNYLNLQNDSSYNDDYQVPISIGNVKTNEFGKLYQIHQKDIQLPNFKKNSQNPNAAHYYHNIGPAL